MSAWTAWSAEAFARAKARGMPVLAVAGARPLGALAAAEGEIARLCVAVFADPEMRPDAAARIGAGRALVLDADGARGAELALPASEPGEFVALLASAVRALPAPSAAPARAARQALDSIPGPASVAAALSALVGDGASAEPEAVESLLHAAGERGDARARAALDRALFEVERAAAEASTLSARARRAGLLWDAHALTGEPRWREAASGATESLLRELFDPAEGAFRRTSEAPVFPADGNAQAASALLRARAYGHPGAGEAANAALDFLRDRLYDPLLGLLHARGGGGESVCGLLGDAAWTALAFTDAFLATGDKARREFADGLLRFLFQELWEREAGGFLDRVTRADDPALLRETRVDPGLNALALEACRRLHHLKGNHNYRRWLEWGLRGAWAEAGADRSALASLARVADLHARGRMDLELVGRAGEPEAEALLAAVHRAYLPRKVISFVDPDDQDYILAHRLEADRYPRLFACGTDLRPLAGAAEPAQVPPLLESLREGA